jgi:hypothetical protein
MLSITPENLPVLAEIGRFQHRGELVNRVGGPGVCGCRGSSYTSKEFSALAFHIQLLSLSVTASPSVVLTSPTKAQPTPAVIFLSSIETGLPRHAGALK